MLVGPIQHPIRFPMPPRRSCGLIRPSLDRGLGSIMCDYSQYFFLLRIWVLRLALVLIKHLVFSIILGIRWLHVFNVGNFSRL
jgi:hypothetical protein